MTLFTHKNIVLMFHVVTSAEWLRNTIKILQKVYNIISTADIESYYYEERRLNNCCHICFDDGDKSFYEKALPVLIDMNIPATLFVSPVVIKKGLNYWFQDLEFIQVKLGESVIRQMIAKILRCHSKQIEKYTISSIMKCMKIDDILMVINNIKQDYNISIDRRFNISEEEFYEIDKTELITFGAHTINHPTLRNESDEKAESEIKQSVELLSIMLERKVRYFAYPNGLNRFDQGQREQEILKRCGIKLSFTTEKGFFNSNTDPFNIPRCGTGGFKRESMTWILTKLALVPFRDKTSRVSRREIKERKAIMNSSIL